MNDSESLDDAELKGVNGGGDASTSHSPDYVNIHNANGDVVGKYEGDGIVYWKCTHCGNPLHVSRGLYWCDACDDWWFSRAGYIWYGTEAELIAASH